ncbi:RNA polymerase II-associated protein 3-like [Hydractinia symbiolongicarpus]|uniref:RNA polymerase II-associated protein 3-like n=1 Tax=Hydractinia symbiolongicarpus TaxID=13093 RepID=UPI00254E5E1C|nr:RNA polymerase II-associated protein 3-like [Hydractinia symbiolongicarpus]
MASKAAAIQMQIRENSDELNDFLKDLNRWEEDIRNEDRNLKTSRRLEEKLPPIRTKLKKKKVDMQEDINNNKEKKTRIKSYDYDAWSKFDVEAACKDVSEDETVEKEDDEDDDEEEEMEKIREQKKLQQAVMEKEKGNQLFKEGKYDAAINRYTDAIALHPNNPILYANRGMALLKTEKYAAAEQDCSTALTYDPSYTKALARRATAREKLKKYLDALEDYQQLLSLEPKNKQAITEVQKINKLLVKTKNTPKQPQDGKSDPATKVVNKIRRSNKPLKRIHIQEVGIEEEEETSNEPRDKKVEDIPVNDRVPRINHVSVENKDTPIPTSSFMFETEFKRLKNDCESLYQYLRKIPVSSYQSLFHQCIDILMPSFLKVLSQCYIRDKLPYEEELKAMATVKRFDMAIMFLAREDKQILTNLLQHLSKDKEETRGLAKKYGVHI